MNIIENIREATRAVRSNLVRSILTVFIIGFGIMAIIGVNTSIEGIKWWLTYNLSSLGSNSFRISKNISAIQRGGNRDRSTINPVITYKEALEFQEGFSTPEALVSISAMGSFNASAKSGNRTSNPNIQLMGTDENYVPTSNYKIAEGRNLSRSDIEMRKNVVVIGSEIYNKLYPNGGAVGTDIQINKQTYSVVGVFGSVGTAGMMGGDKICIIPISTLRKETPYQLSYSIAVFLPDPEMMVEKIEEATGLFRRVRGLRPKDRDNFGISKSDQFVNSLMDNLQVLTLSATVIAIITLVSAAIGLLNIMLVSVTERTREIGVRKALGARNYNIMLQFLTEAVVICQFGAVIGIILGILAGNVIGMMIGTDFLVPWNWVIFGIVVCTLVGLGAGSYPAWKASRLDPIDALRYE
ncbi:MAG: ABC transporter permease [Bacteroidia bacterium]|nr:ABC transporter permease [Bacteroidia bacterium]